MGIRNNFFGIVLLLGMVTAMVGCMRGEDMSDGHQEFTYVDVDTTGAEKFMIDMVVVIPTEDVCAKHEIITRGIVGELMGEAFVDKSIGNILKSYADTARHYFRLINADYLMVSEKEYADEDMASVFVYEEELKIRPKSVRDSIITYERELYMFQGGAHGLSTKKYVSFDMRTGERVMLEDMLSSDERMIAGAELLLSADSLRGVGVLPEEDDVFNNKMIGVTENFYLTDSGMVFVYNPYDIAPYVYGGVEISIDNK